MDITTPLTSEIIENLKIGDMITLTGEIYTARDSAHKRLCEAISQGDKLPIDIKGAIIYYVGPTDAKDGEVIGSCGPTTSYRMDAYSPILMELGLKAMIGKGERCDKVVDSICENKCVYLGAYGGLGALISSHVVKSEIICYEDLGTEAIRKLTVNKLPLVVIIDSKGNNLYKTGQNKFKEI